MKNYLFFLHKTYTSILLFLLIEIVLACNICVAGCSDDAANSITSFGRGKIKVRLYSDYFCGPCGATEPIIEPVIKTLVQDNVINITFIDVPFHPPKSVIYAKYFLYVLNEKRDFNHVLFARNILFKAAREKVIEKNKIEEYLCKNNIKFKVFDTSPVFKIFEGYLNKEDKINSTPTCVIERNNKKEVHKGGMNILKSLESLKPRKINNQGENNAR